MKPPDCTKRRSRLVILYKGNIYAMIPECLQVIALKEIPSLIPENGGFNY
jgi:hypothetical protein